jgi:hypothetical protein
MACPHPLPEPCLKAFCYAPDQCASLGYCKARDDNARQGHYTTRELKRCRAAQRKAAIKRLEEGADR